MLATEPPASLPAILRRRVVYRGYLSVATLLLRLRDGAIVSRDVKYHGDAAAVLPYDPVRRCALVARLFRGPVFDATGAGNPLDRRSVGGDTGQPDAEPKMISPR